ncbi:MAG: cell division protein FtsK, partial [Actinomycetota bacterium]|nr:cell division protein FtsK [Actinomycetota bacterium]
MSTEGPKDGGTGEQPLTRAQLRALRAAETRDEHAASPGASAAAPDPAVLPTPQPGHAPDAAAPDPNAPADAPPDAAASSASDPGAPAAD